MKKLVITDEKIGGTHYEELPVILDDNEIVVLLPLIYSAHLSNVGEVITINTYDQNGEVTRKFETTPVGKATASTYISCLYRFLVYLNSETRTSDSRVSIVHQLYKVDQSCVNHYLNQVLPQSLSLRSLGIHCSAIKSFFSLLAYLKLRAPHEVAINRVARKAASLNNTSDGYIQYISTDDRNRLINTCTSKRDRLILRLGYEVGLRSSELCGMLLRNEKGSGEFLLDLFAKLDLPEYSQRSQFVYPLLGKFTKRGKSRILYLDRNLLSSIRDYYRTERMAIISRINGTTNPPELFLRTDRKRFGAPIGVRQGSNTFSKYKRHAHLNENLSYHCLRHTFGTELYHSELLDSTGKETRSESAALLTTAIRLGHSLGNNGLPKEVTTRYIRMREQMLEIESLGGFNEG